MDGVNILNSSEEIVVMEEDKEIVFNDLNEAWDYAYAAIAGLWLMIGVPGNLMVIVSCIIFKDMHTIPMALATNLAMSDTFVASANVATTWLTILYDRRVLLDNRGLCILTSNICGLGCVCSMASICNIAINRYVAICHNSVYSTIYNAKTVILHLASTWIAGIVITGPVFIGFRDVDHRWDRRQLFCARSNVTETGYDWVQWWELALLIPTSLAIMTFTYTRIFTRVRQSSKNLQKGDDKETFTQRDIQLLKTLIIMFISFLVANFPWFLLVTFDFHDTAPHELYYVTGICFLIMQPFMYFLIRLSGFYYY